MKYILNRIFFGILIAFILFLNYSTVYAGSSSLTKWDSSGAFNLVISLKWKPTATDTTHLDTVFKLFASDVYKMTEGKHFLKTLYVYTPDPITNKEREWGKADIQFENNGDLANATPNGFTHNAGRIWVDDNLNDLNEVGHAMAHELGHYAYGLYDEYKPTSTTYDSIDYMPHSTDNRKITLMADHRTNQQFSLDSDYSSTTQNTAQWRMNESSCWATLVRDPIWDLFNPRLTSQLPRYEFPDLNALANPTVLTQPAGAPDVEIIYMGGSEAVIIIDHSGSMAESTSVNTSTKMQDAKSGAKSYLDKLKETDYAAVVIYDDVVSTLASLALLDSTTKAGFKASIDTIAPGNNTAIGAALRSGLNILNASTRKGTFKYIVLLTDGLHNSGESPTGAVLTDLQSAGYPVYSIGLGANADMATLGAVSTGTRGKSYFASSAATLNAIYSDIQSMTSDDKLTAWVKDNLNLSKPSKTTSVIVDPSSKKAIFSAAFPNTQKMGLSLIMPNNALVDSTTVSAFSNINYIKEPGYIIYEVTDPASGEWQMELSLSSADTTNIEVILEAKTDADYSLDLEANGGKYPEPILITATPYRRLNIKGATVEATVTVTDTTGAVTTSAIGLKDDGLSPDYIAGDGKYTGIIANYINGDYTFNAKVSNPSGTSVETPHGTSIKAGSSIPEVKITENFNLSANASLKTSGVISDDYGSTFAGATRLLDSTIVNGKLETDGDVDYFYFDATGGNSYTFYTSKLYPEDMITLIKLYDSDSATVLGQDKTGNQGGGSNIIWHALSSKRCYLTVSHGNNKGTGVYSIGVKPTQTFDKIFLGNIDTLSPGSITRVDGHDLYILKRAFGSDTTDTNWNALADLDGNSIIDGNDLIPMAANFGK
ncbi:MAG: VWA domain-containing protein [bacterium]|nr:VWA domain-containing protein [bacterium]